MSLDVLAGAPTLDQELADGAEIPLGAMPTSAERVDSRRSRRLAAEAKQVGDRGQRRPLSTARGVSAWVLATIAFLALWFVIYTLALTPFQEARAQSTLYGSLREQLAQQVAPLGGEIRPGAPVALMDAPALGLSDVVVVEGTASGDLMAGPGHRRDTVLPGQPGVSVIYGRSTLFGGPFDHLARLQAGDDLKIVTGQGTFSFRVIDRRVAGDRLPLPVAEGAGRLTLVSAAGTGRFGTWVPSATVYVDADLVGKTQPAPDGRPVVVPMAERALQGDPSALLPLSLSLPLLVLAVMLVVWAHARWGGWQTWLVGAPVVLAGLWLVSQSAVQLLPNLM